MNERARDQAWGKYLSCCRAGGTPDERRFAFRRWWKLELAESVAVCAAQVSAEKRKRVKATSTP